MKITDVTSWVWISLGSIFLVPSLCLFGWFGFEMTNIKDPYLPASYHIQAIYIATSLFLGIVILFSGLWIIGIRSRLAKSERMRRTIVVLGAIFTLMAAIWSSYMLCILPIYLTVEPEAGGWPFVMMLGFFPFILGLACIIPGVVGLTRNSRPNPHPSIA